MNIFKIVIVILVGIAGNTLEAMELQLHVPDQTDRKQPRSRSPSPRPSARGTKAGDGRSHSQPPPSARPATATTIRPFNSDQVGRDRRKSEHPVRHVRITSPTLTHGSPTSSSSHTSHSSQSSRMYQAPVQSSHRHSTHSTHVNTVRESDGDEFTDEFKNLTVNDAEPQNPAVEASQEKFMDLVLDLYHAIATPDLKKVERISQLPDIQDFMRTHHVASVLSNKDYVALRETVFNHYKILTEKMPCSPLWASVEFVLSVAKDDPTYKQRLKIVKLLAPYGDTKERKELRKKWPPHWWSWFCLPCGPCISACWDVEGGLLHRAAQKNSVDVLKILLKNKFDINEKDEEGDSGWTAFMYAVWFDSPKAAKFLKDHKAIIKEYWCMCCYGECECI